MTIEGMIVTDDSDGGYYFNRSCIMSGYRSELDRRFWIAWTHIRLCDHVARGVMDDFGSLVETRHLQ